METLKFIAFLHFLAGTGASASILANRAPWYIHAISVVVAQTLVWLHYAAIAYLWRNVW